MLPAMNDKLMKDNHSYVTLHLCILIPSGGWGLSYKQWICKCKEQAGTANKITAAVWVPNNIYSIKFQILDDHT